jgi:hypothetical protein
MSFLFDFTLDIVIWRVRLTKYIIVGNAGELRWETALQQFGARKWPMVPPANAAPVHGRERGNWRAPWVRLHLSFSESHNQPIPGRN